MPQRFIPAIIAAQILRLLRDDGQPDLAALEQLATERGWTTQPNPNDPLRISISEDDIYARLAETYPIPAGERLAMQHRCLACGGEHYAMAVFALSHGAAACWQCGAWPTPMTESAYSQALQEARRA